MNNETYELIQENYTTLFNNFCKYQNKYKINNCKTCEDSFNDKILYFLELEIEHPTLEILLFFIKHKRKLQKKVNTISLDIVFLEFLASNSDNFKNYNSNIRINISKYTDSCEEYNKYNSMIDSFKYLFIDKNNKSKC